MGPDEIILADTIGVWVPKGVRELVGEVFASGITTGCHFPNTRNTGFANALAAVESGATVLDAAVGGTGGCPFAPQAAKKLGNIATEDLVYLLHGMGLEQIGQRSPLLGHVRPGRRHRDLREPAGDERGEDNADLPVHLVEGLAGEHEARAGGQPLRPGRKARVGRLEPEVVPAHQAGDTFPEAAGQGEQVFPCAAGGGASGGIPHRLRGEGRRHEEASRLEVEARVHE